MAIRIGLPTVAGPRLNVGWNATRQSFAGHIRSLQLTAERLVRTPFAWGIRLAVDFRRRFSLRNRVMRRQRALLKAFDDRYEQLVDLLCWSAQSSTIGSKESRYRDLRSWMRNHYGSLRSHLLPHWSNSTPSARDPFESLIACDRLDEVLSSYSSIEDMMLCRKALDAYRISLINPA
jgi:hypothetical protein